MNTGAAGVVREAECECELRGGGEQNDES